MKQTDQKLPKKIKGLGVMSESDAAILLELSALLKNYSTKPDITLKMIRDLFRTVSEISLIKEKLVLQFIAVILRSKTISDLDDL